MASYGNPETRETTSLNQYRFIECESRTDFIAGHTDPVAALQTFDGSSFGITTGDLNTERSQRQYGFVPVYDESKGWKYGRFCIITDTGGNQLIRWKSPIPNVAFNLSTRASLKFENVMNCPRGVEKSNIAEVVEVIGGDPRGYKRYSGKIVKNKVERNFITPTGNLFHVSVDALNGFNQMEIELAQESLLKDVQAVEAVTAAMIEDLYALRLIMSAHLMHEGHEILDTGKSKSKLIETDLMRRKKLVDLKILNNISRDEARFIIHHKLLEDYAAKVLE